ncbi:MAG: hypothetical protein LPJ87_06560 [Zoogloeaceae bacterium]|nr:hypothetical protein [Zoogloeaceae bacterium]
MGMKIVGWFRENWLKIVFLTAFLFVVKACIDHSDKDIKKLYEWPEDLKAGEVSMCPILDYRECKSWDWISIFRSSTVLKDQTEYERILGADYSDLMDLVCMHRDSLSSNRLRIIEDFAPGVNLVLCRMREKDSIDRGRFLEIRERIESR